MKQKSEVLPLESLMTQAINSDSPESVDFIHQMLTKNGMTVTWEMIQTAQKRGVTKVIWTLTGVPYDAEHEMKRRMLD